MIFNQINVGLSIVLSLILKRACDEIEPKSSLVFVIDKTLSMGPVIEGVKSGASAIFDAVASSAESPIENFVMVLFGDPSVSEALVTTDSKEFKATLQSITLEDGGLCPELAMTGILKALDASMRGSYVYVFTDATAEDFDKFEQVKRLAQEKECQVVFFLTSKCANRTELSEDFIVYPNLAEATSGQVFHMHEQDIDMILKYVKHSITSRRVTLLAKKYPPGDHTLDIESDSKTKDLTVAITAAGMTDSAEINAYITGPDGESIDEDALIRMGEMLILKVSDCTPGIYKVDLSCKVPSYVVVTAKSDVKFRHGFSKNLLSSLDNSVFSPVPATKNYLHIKLFGENVQLTSVKFLSPSYHNLLELPLKLLHDKQKLYVTELFDPPSSKFRIAVKGLDTETNTNLTRFGSLILESEFFLEKTPKINIKGVSKLTIDYNSKVKLNCTVEAYPEPRTFVWRDAVGREIPSELRRVPPYNSYRILELEHLKKSEIYECYAVNRLGNDKKNLQVQVNPKPYINIEEPKSQTLKYDEKCVLQCKVNSFPPAKISWLLNKKKNALVKHGDIILSLDNSTLTISHMKPWTRGKYACKVEYLGRSHLLPYAAITLSGKPKLEKPLHHDIFLKEGENTDLTCSLLQGNPQPEIKWFYQFTQKSYASVPVQELKRDLNKTRKTIVHANEFDSGIYKCIARNIIGLDIRVFNLTVGSKPTITLDPKKRIVVEKDTEVNIKCTVKGVPTPEVVWLKDGVSFKNDKAGNTTVFRDHSLRLKGNMKHSGNYTCKAVNKLGSTNDTVEVTVYYTDAISPSITKFKRKINEFIYIPCDDYIKGVPKPDLKWIFFSFDKTVSPRTLSPKRPSLRPGAITITNGNLNLTRIAQNQRGNYTCVASKFGQPKNITFEVDVLFPPRIQNKRVPYVAVVGDLMLKIQCHATGNPQPAIIWRKNSLKLAAVYGRQSFENNWLMIQNVEKKDEGDYTCQAKNEEFDDEPLSRDIKVVVHRCPPPETIKRIKNTKPLLVEKGNNKLVKCHLPHTEFNTINWYKNGNWYHKGELELEKAKISNSGIYTCRVSKVDSPIKENANTSVIVGFKPTFKNNPRVKLQIYREETVSLDCLISAEPLPIITWWHEDKQISFSGIEYEFKMEAKTAGKFTCEATNVFGSVSRTFDIVLKEFTDCVLQIDEDAKNQPLLITTSRTWPEFKTEHGYTIIPKLQKFVFACQSHFTMFEEPDLQATCYGGKDFFVKDKVLDYSKIKCKKDLKPKCIKPKRYNKKIPCQGDKTTTAKLIFGKDPKDPKNIDAIEYCLDRELNPIYAKYIMRSPADYVPKNTTMWDGTNLDIYSCGNQKIRFSRFFFDTTKCCFAKRHLVNPRDLFPGPLQRAAYNRLNIVPHWSTCHSENWDEVEEKVRRLANSIDDDLIIFTGTANKLFLDTRTHGVQTLALKKQQIAMFLWKVVQYPAAKSSVAIVQVNVPEVESSDIYLYIRCTDICHELPWMIGTNWHQVEKGYTYCCKLNDFIDKFNKIKEILFEPYFKLLKG